MAEGSEQLPPGVEEANGRRYMVKADGSLTPVDQVKEMDLLDDQLVREFHARAEALAKALGEFKAAAFDAVDARNGLLWDKYKTTPRGSKGNQSLSTYDGKLRILVQVADQISFGDELQVARDLITECVLDWGAESRSELVALVENAFRTNKAGQINRGALLSLLSLNITDAKWMRGMDAIRDSIRVEGSKRYIRFAERVGSDDHWIGVALDLANAKMPPPAAPAPLSSSKEPS
ncbi:DUF3164 family protein [Caulobacter rhizosphaerae]|uniref:DUF3164 family protein n=1 Tax=Caulobacter rhizosphaerae TaxID=2010972 RepID=UPI0013D2F96F|nr:DUF3164 family protein [Caulobacter rhizosphaerae]GGL48318.1 hypothetical protein GCM10010983_52090 [Caulobacter rhizosphaerae]